MFSCWRTGYWGISQNGNRWLPIKGWKIISTVEIKQIYQLRGKIGNSNLKSNLKHNPGNTGQRFLFFPFVNSPFSSYTKTPDWKSIKSSFKMKEGKGAVSTKCTFLIFICRMLVHRQYVFTTELWLWLPVISCWITEDKLMNILKLRLKIQ